MAPRWLGGRNQPPSQQYQRTPRLEAQAGLRPSRPQLMTLTRLHLARRDVTYEDVTVAARGEGVHVQNRSNRGGRFCANLFSFSHVGGHRG